MARDVAAAETKRFGRAAGLLSVGDRLGRPAHLRLLLARLARPRQGRLRRGRRPVVGGVRDDLRPVSAGRAAALAHDRRASGARAADRPAAQGRSDDPARRSRARSRSRRSCSAGRCRTTSSPETRRSTGSSSPPSSRSRQASSPGAFWPAAGASLSTAPSCSPSRPRGCRSPWRSPSGSPAGRPRSRSGSSPRPCSASRSFRSPSRAEPWPGAAPRRRHPRWHPVESEFTLAAGGGFAAAVLLIMVSEQTLLNAGPLLVRASEGAAAAGFIFNVLMIARAPLVLFQAVATSLLPHLTRLRSSASEEDAEAFRLSVRFTLGAIAAFAAVVGLVVAIAGPELMQLAFGKKFAYDRLGLVIVTVGMGFYLCSGTLNQAALAQGQVRRAAACWVGLRARLHRLEPASGAGRVPSRRGRVRRRGRPALRAPVPPLPPPARSSGGRRRARLATGARGAAGRRGRGELTERRRLGHCVVLGAGGRRDPPVGLGRLRVAEHRRAGDEQGRSRLGDACPPCPRPRRRPPRSSRRAPGCASLETLSGEDAMKGCPPQPGFTDMQRTTSADPVSSVTDVGGRPGVQREAREAAGLADRPEGAMSVGVGLEVERDAVGAGAGELGDLIGRALDHQVDVDRAAGLVDLVGDRRRRPAGRS